MWKSKPFIDQYKLKEIKGKPFVDQYKLKEIKGKPFVDQYKLKEIKFSLHKRDWKISKVNNKSIALNVLYVPYNTEKRGYAYKSKIT